MPERVIAGKERQKLLTNSLKTCQDNPDDIPIPDGLISDLERIAGSVHRVWMRGRMDEGWKWGPHRDDQKMENPCIVPYEQLSETDKEYDRQTVLQTIRALLALGYQIIPGPSDDSDNSDSVA